jgi:hypothetical protein
MSFRDTEQHGYGDGIRTDSAGWQADMLVPRGSVKTGQ